MLGPKQTWKLFLSFRLYCLFSTYHYLLCLISNYYMQTSLEVVTETVLLAPEVYFHL